ncbi:hypothetical protein [Roseibacillus persicicus]|uniref:hypothetical protein n=1 Tax=Roseibacillus persicicus TaxID=454148 RepID=UPI00280DE132|nr:hypothetical protein [Roseibacillus persicicus]MDQ8192673.1 hypothetical protein [Roseibacillus persicicus]
MKIFYQISAVIALLVCSCENRSRKSSGWFAVNSESGGFQIEMPSEPKSIENKFPLPDGLSVEGWNYIYEDSSGLSFTAGYVDWPESWVSSRPSSWFLDSGRDGMIKTLGGSLTRESNIEIDGHPGRDVMGRVPGLGSIWGRVYMVNNRFHQVSVVYKTDEPSFTEIETFFNSFTLK